SNKEISKLLAQFSLKHIETSQAPDNKVVMEETKIIKDFLQNSMFSTTSNKNLTPALSTSSEKPADHSVLGQRSQLPVFAKICANIASRAGNHRFQNSETNQNVMEGYNGKDEGAIHPSLSQFKMETCSSEKSLGSMKQNLSVVSSNMKKSVGKSEKSILYELLGTAKKVDGQSALYNSKTDVHGAESKLKPSLSTATTNLKYTGNIFTPRSAATATVTSNRPPLLNYAPPLPPNPSNYTQYQALYQQRARMPYQQTLHPQLGCFARQVNPYNYQQVAQQFLRPPYSPVVSYIPFVQPDFSYQPRNIPKPPSNTQEAPAMAGDGPQFLYQPAYGY
uniref:Chromosome 1 open reading frame 94 n=1 Tax=Latimeria chalumnae TaxID=7897 RepID=H3A150_LATCH